MVPDFIRVSAALAALVILFALVDDLAGLLVEHHEDILNWLRRLK